jgi:tetratricopeptide (TPR) repeat protein
MIKRFVPLTFLLVFFICADLFPQSRIQNKMNFYDAESWILFEDYKEALPLYQQLIKSYPDNSNLKYRIGQCYLNLPGEKDKAIAFLEDAVKNINPKYKEGRFRESGAPHDALYYLANAYRINYQLDKALETYGLFMKNLDTRIYDSTIVNLQIESCHNAKILMGKPLYVSERNLGNNINEASSEYNPVISDDENIMVFSQSLAFYDAIQYSTKVNGSWTAPQNMNELLKVDRDIYPTSISSDGKELYLYNSENYDGNIYSTRFENGTWTPIVKLNDNINTKFWESHAAISHDNNKLYFTSNRKNSIGGLDIYVSERDSTGDWGPAKNLGPVINTPYNEDTPFLRNDDRTLYFSSRGHFNMGGHDIFYSTLLENGEWSVPVNLGFPLNSTDDDLFFKPVNDGYEGYFAKYSPDGFGRQDIYRLEIFSGEHPRKFYVQGVAAIDGLSPLTEDRIRVSATSKEDQKQSLVVYTNPRTGEYDFQVPQGDYALTFEAPGGEKVTRDLHLPLTNLSDTFKMPGTALPKTDFIAGLYVGSDNNITVTSGTPVIFPLKVESNSLLTVEHWSEDSLLYVEHFNIADSAFNYRMVPQPGNSRITFRITDKFGNTASSDVFITREKDIVSQRVVRPEYRKAAPEKQTATLTEKAEKSTAENTIKEIAPKNIPAEITEPEAEVEKGKKLWYLWLLAGTGLIFLFIILARKKKKDNQKG